MSGFTEGGVGNPRELRTRPRGSPAAFCVPSRPVTLRAMPMRPRLSLSITILAGVLAILFLIIGAVTGNYGAWATGGAFVIAAGIMAYLRARDAKVG